MTMRYTTIDRCTDPDCRCIDTAGVVLYDGPDLAEAEAAKESARYPDPIIEAGEYHATPALSAAEPGESPWA